MSKFIKTSCIVFCFTFLLLFTNNLSVVATTKSQSLCNLDTTIQIGSNSKIESKDKEISVYVSAKKIYFSDAKPYIKNGSTLLPLRACAEAMGAQVFWNNDTSEIFMYRDGIEIRLKINSSTVSVQKYTFINNQMAYISEKEEKWINIAPEIEAASKRTYVPLRAIGELFNAEVAWEKDGKPRTVTIDNLSILSEATSKIDKNMHMFVNVLFYDVPTIPQKVPVTIFVYTTINGEKKPVGDATVTIEGMENDSGKTYTNGKVSILNVPVGEKKVIVQKDGYYMNNSNVVINVSKEDTSEKSIEVINSSETVSNTPTNVNK